MIPESPHSALAAGAIRFALVLGAALAVAPPLSGQIHCDVLRTSAGTYAGRCVADSRTVALLVLHSPEHGMAGRWLGTRARVFGVQGDSTKDVVDWTAFGPDFVDLGPDSLFGQCWCKVTRAHVDQDGLHFEADPERRAPPTRADLHVLTRVRGHFSDPARWDRHSLRTRGVAPCPARPSSRTLYCALYEAEVAVRGEAYLFTPAAAAIRDAIREVAAPRGYQHPLDGFNNDPAVAFETFQRMLDNAVERVRAALSSTPGGA